MFAFLGKFAFFIVIVRLTWSLRDVASRTQTMFNEPLSKELIDHINRIDTTWKAGVNFGEDDDVFIYQLTRTSPSSTNIPKLPVKIHDDHHIWGKYGDVPVSFDARQAWPNCTTIGRIQDQGACSAGWAIAATEAMTDRYCTLSKNQNSYVNISTEDIVSCCGSACGDGCAGGFATAVWHHWVNTGVVTGGVYNSSSGCKPYTIKTCQHRMPSSGFGPQTTALPPCDDESVTPVCLFECQKNYSIAYKDDMHFGKTAYTILPNVSQIQAEILNHGPVQANMIVYADFFSYKSGVYKHDTGAAIGHHSVKLIGWGMENKVPYWLAVNSWNSNWGDKGLVKIFRGKNECEIEANVLAGTPKR